MDDDAEAEFAAFVHARWSAFVRASVFLGCGLQEAQDLTQTAMARCWDKWDKVRRATDRDAYTYRVLLNCVRDSKRRHWWRETPTETFAAEAAHALGGHGDPGHGDVVATADAVHRALAALGDDQRRVVVLRYFVNFDEAQCAAVLGVPVGTVKSRHARALARLASSDHLTDFADGSTS